MVRTAHRIVKCPKCDVLLQEPPPGTLIYQCGGCSATLQNRPATQVPEQVDEEVHIDNDSQRRQPDFSSHGHLSPAFSPMDNSSPYSGSLPLVADFPDRQPGSSADPAYGMLVQAAPAHEVPYSYSFYARFFKNSDKPSPVHYGQAPDSICITAPLPTRANTTSKQPHPPSSDSRHISALSRSTKPRELEETLPLPVVSFRDKNASAAMHNLKSAPGYDFVPFRAYDGQPAEAVKQVVGHENAQRMGPQKNLRWKPKSDQSAARLLEVPHASTATDRREHHDSCKTPRKPLHDEQQVPGLGMEYRHDMGIVADLDRGLDMYEAPADVGDYELSEYSSSVSEADGNRLGDMEYNCRCSVELAVGNLEDRRLLDYDSQRTQSDVTVSISAFPAGDVSTVSDEHICPDQKVEHAHEKQTTVAMPSDLFSRVSPGYTSTYNGQERSAGQDERMLGTVTYTHPTPVAICQDQQVRQPCFEAQLDDLGNEADLHQQETNAPGPRGSRSAAPYSYKLLLLQPFGDSDWSRRCNPVLQIIQEPEAESHKQQKTKLYPLFPTPPNPPYVVCQHCLQLLVLPLNFPLLTRNTQKLRCSGCMCISVFAVELTIGRGDSLGDVLGVSNEHDSRNSPSEVVLTSSFTASTFEHMEVGCSKLNAGVSIATIQPVPLPSPLSYATSDAATAARNHGTPPLKGKGILEEFRRSFERPTSDQGQEQLQDYSGAISSIHASSDCESDYARNGSSLGNITVPPLPDHHSGSIDEYDSHSPYPPSSTTVQDGLKGRNKVVSIIKGLKEFTKTGQGKIYRRQVYVNSRAIPDPLVKKAEEYAGPIHPGHYWYDVHAGFWGVMGGPCKGIVPPFIEELNYPLPRDCSGGRTGVLVNGRDLHLQDLEILSRRGLPTTPGMSYRVEIDGRVTEENSGQELKSLGRLAPSVVKRGRGHGMVVT